MAGGKPQGQQQVVGAKSKKLLLIFLIMLSGCAERHQCVFWCAHRGCLKCRQELKLMILSFFTACSPLAQSLSLAPSLDSSSACRIYKGSFILSFPFASRNAPEAAPTAAASPSRFHGPEQNPIPVPQLTPSQPSVAALLLPAHPKIPLGFFGRGWQHFLQ